jgi:hypothetical protein
MIIVLYNLAVLTTPVQPELVPEHPAILENLQPPTHETPVHRMDS